jgi:hypothetical protein
MAAIDFPNSPSVNDQFTAAGITWEWNGTTWDIVASGVAPPDLEAVLTEGNDGGALQIKNIADPTDPQDAATKAYVDTRTANDNLFLYYNFY